MILKCTCYHRFQNTNYGPGLRKHNLAEKGYQGSKGWRCTVCGNCKSANVSERAFTSKEKT